MSKKKNLQPINERSLLLVFESDSDLDCWLAWYNDGGGEQDAGYIADLINSNSRASKDRTLVLNGPEERCPECKSQNILDQADPQEHIQKRIDYFSKGRKLKKQFLCEDCGQNFNMEE
jgi:hypothetical protein